MKPIYKHCVIIASNYTSGKRIALHFLYNETNIDTIKNIVNEYATYRGVSIYSVNTDSHDIGSIKKKEPFFSNVEILDGHILLNQKLFREIANKQIDAYDVAMLLLTRDSMTYDDLLCYLFFIYVEVVIKFNKFIFENSVKLDHHKIVINKVSREKIVPKCKKEHPIIFCKKENVVLSRFFNNNEGGVELMNLVLLVYERLKKLDIKILRKKIDDIWAQLITKEKNKNHIYFINKKLIKNFVSTFSVLD